MGFLSAVSAILSHVKVIVYVVALVGIVGTIGYLKLRLDAAEAHAAQYQSEAESERENAKALSDQLYILNASVQAADELLAKRETDRLAAEQKADKAQKKYRDILEDLKHATPNTCASVAVDNSIIEWMRESTR